ncbi:cytochrome P450 [Actinoplanes sp. NPDC051343]|uniref:cytochrome P450 n=1 Tax=Actinoplanes sp. NPDC051343 TaxID=3363906 RepID=UPI0037B459F0
MNSPELVLDPTARRRAAEEAVLHAAGGPVLVDILGEAAWAIGDPDLLRQLLSDPRVSKDPRQHWPRFIEGEIVGKWPLYLQVSVDNMFTAYGQAHRRLRRLVSPVFAARRLDGLLPSIERNTAGLLDELAALGSGPVDLRQAFAVQLPVRVMSDLLGIPQSMRAPFKETIDRIWNTTSSASDALAATQDVYAMLTALIALKRDAPGDDLTTGLVQTPELTDRELVDTLLLIVAAGYETTVNLIDNAVVALLADRAQVAHVRAGRASWGDVIEETMRFAAPVSHMPMRYAVSDIELPGGAVIRRGEAILPSFGAASNHPRHQPPGTAGTFDVTRPDRSHVALGHGVHFCLGAPLARAEGATALAGLFGRFPAMRLAVPAASLEPVPSILGNGHLTLPVHLGTDGDHARPASSPVSRPRL